MKKILITIASLVTLFSTQISSASSYEPSIYKIIEYTHEDFEIHSTKLINSINKTNENSERNDMMTNSLVISRCIYFSTRPLNAIYDSYLEGNRNLTSEDSEAFTKLLNLFAEAGETLDRYADNIENFRIKFTDTSELQLALTKIREGQAKLNEILERKDKPPSAETKKK